MILIKNIVWDEWNIDHIKKHHVTTSEVEEICLGIYQDQPTYNDRLMIFGKTTQGRALTVVLSKKLEGKYYIITARDMSTKERRKYL